MTQEQIKHIDANSVMQTYKRYDIVIDHGIGSKLYSIDSREYIDFTSGIGVNSLGYGNKKWIDAIIEQTLKLGHISNLFYSEPYVLLAKMLTERSGMSRVFFSNSGAEANEGMIKLARKYSQDKYGCGRSVILTLNRSFHGRTITTLAATGQEKFHKYFHPFTEGFRHIEANDFRCLTDALVMNDVCAIMVELVQGEGGVFQLDLEYVQRIERLCCERDILFMIDEVQTGIGRTGKLFAYERYGIMPDVVSFAKGVAGGLAMGGFLSAAKVSDVFGIGDHGSTFGGNPIAAAAAVQVLSQIDEFALESIARNGQYISQMIDSWDSPLIREIRGLGLMLGVQLQGVLGEVIIKRCLENGLLILPTGFNSLRLLPPLTITKDEIDAGLSILKRVVTS